MHIGGKGRRVILSGLFIREAVPKADKTVVVEGDDHDRIFSSILESKNIETLSA
ncbi:hypothetical protein KJ966_08255 [bacterium]|nr:hypothetical protein [bacterium]